MDPPWVLKKTFPEDDPCLDGSMKTYWGGVWIFALDTVCKSLRMRCKIYGPVPSPDSVFYGDSVALRDIVTGKADMGVHTMLITASRFESGNYSMIPSLISRSYGMVVHKRHLVSDVATSSQRMLFYTFTPTAWAGIGVLLLVIFTALLLSQKLRTTKFGRTARWSDLWFDVFMGVVSNTWPGHLTVFKRNLVSSITLIITSVVFSLMVVTLFKTTLPSKLATSPLAKLPFTTMEELLLTDFKIYGAVAVKESLKNTRKKIIQTLATRMEGVSGKDLENYYQFISRDEATRAVYMIPEEGRAVLSTDYSCDFVEAIAHVQDYPAAQFWFRNGSRLFKKFSRQ
ncbi:hypothetical protein RvY_16461 [Ramazzottius varieornatus]|uniref:Ionotropic glutamate receptor C-terminal domain-containing protein n=1 Tax=Ramazzottius varieornatus TaxID=947166 RepID=A0A1D1VYJ1_RAMVA|nr:hypothetical protein RvY_16461 [Ramazzottius varieornatus]